MSLSVLSSVLIGLVGALCFYSSVLGTFVFDDTEAILNNRDIRLDTPWTEIFKNDFWGTRMTHRDSHKSYRPITVLSFRLNVYFNKGILDPYGFHFVNIVLHGVICSLTFPLFLTLFSGKYSYQMALMSSLLFAVHPIHSEAVAGIVGRADLLCALFSIIAYLVYARATVSKLKSRSVILTLVSAIFTACAMFSKEQGITILGICSAYDIIVANGVYPKDIVRNLVSWSIYKDERLKKSQPPVDSKLKMLFLRQTLLVVTGSVLLYYRYHLMGFQTPTFSHVDNPASFAQGFLTRVMNYNYIYGLNLWLLLCPDWLCFDWSMGCVPLIHLSPSFADLRILFVILFWCSAITFIFKSIYQSRSYSSVLLMGLVFLIVPFLVASNLLFRVGFVIAERVLYLPSIGFCIIVSLGLQSLYFNSNQKLYTFKCISVFCAGALFLLVQAGFMLLVIINILRCNDRSLDWLNERSLFESGLRVCPLNAKVHYNLAKTSINISESIRHYRRALELHPEYEQAMNNLANILRDNGNTAEAEQLLKQAVVIRPNFPAAWMNLGIVLSNMGRYDEALEAYNTALTYRKVYPDCHYNLGNLFLSQKKYNEAYYSWRKATSQKNNHAVAWNNMIVMLDSLGELTRAEKLGREALRYLPEDSSIHFNLGNTLGKQQKFEQAELYFKRAIALRQGTALYHTNLGVLYHRWKKYQLAKEQYSLALLINPNSTNAYQNLKVVKKFL